MNEIAFKVTKTKKKELESIFSVRKKEKKGFYSQFSANENVLILLNSLVLQNKWFRLLFTAAAETATANNFYKYLPLVFRKATN